MRGLGVVERKYGEAAASDKISLRRIRTASGDCCKHAGILPFSTEARLPAAAITVSGGCRLGLKCICSCGIMLLKLWWHGYLTSRGSTRGNVRNKFQGRSPFCSVWQKFFLFLVYRGPAIPFRWVQKVRHCSRAGCTRRCMLRCWY